MRWVHRRFLWVATSEKRRKFCAIILLYRSNHVTAWWQGVYFSCISCNKRLPFRSWGINFRVWNIQLPQVLYESLKEGMCPRLNDFFISFNILWLFSYWIKSLFLRCIFLPSHILCWFLCFSACFSFV